MKLPNNHQRDAAAFNMTPMIDVVFLLIIFFLVSSHLASREARMELELPDATSGDPAKPDDRPLIINIDQNGDIWLAGNQLSPPDLAERLRRSVDESPDVTVRIRGDRRTRYAAVQPVLAACGVAGVAEVDVAVRSEEAP